jgi:type II secretory pathway component PulF
MDEAEVVIAARRETYRVVSWVIFAVSLLLLVVVGLVLPLFYLPHQMAIYRDMGRKLPMITQYVINYSNPVIFLLGTGFLGTLLVVKEILAAPKARLWVNVVTLLLLLIWGACYFFAVSLPMWDMMQAMQGQ